MEQTPGSRSYINSHCKTATLLGEIARWLGADQRVIWRPGQGCQEVGCPGDSEFLEIFLLHTRHLHTEDIQFFF